ncbi:TauD/TfdA family dioxygenase [Streptomyces sp. NBC_00083]|uniref:TauD/TfdA family dioxygenase n=1 Tax=Streptomyces sp. NBC_00083 TaxID=2975647 RepID=UPI0022570213|nr:TauD/TfdA family dioxygenase [Streptomyces sp. NBC_00083]MCX5385399.1 TauD/TfdA family dioxygenase [Streptomyces sp. NBC_00083]
MTTVNDPGSVAARAPGRHLTHEEGRPPVLHTGPSDAEHLPAPEVRALLAEHGAVLVRGLGLAEPADLAVAARALGVRGTTEREGFTGRQAHPDGVYSTSEWAAEDQLCMHHELSYAAVVPSIALFGCLVAPQRGGATTVADGERVLGLLPGDLVAGFERDGWELARTYYEFGLGWAEAFGTDDRARVEEYCAANALDHTWTEEGGLRTRQRRPALLRHPVTGRRGWFNQAAFLHESALDPVVREYLESLYGPEGLPFRTTYGNGEPISTDTVATINKAYEEACWSEPWQQGDLLVLDNLRMAHGRDPYEGERRIVALFGDPVRLAGPGAPSADATR